jgi:hypothetical protein
MVKFYFKLGKTTIEVYQDLKNVCVDDCVELCTSLHMFQEGRESLEDDPSPG